MNLSEFVTWSNAGFCATSLVSLNSNIFAISTDTDIPLSGLTNDQLSELCKQGNGRFNSACRELLERCNAGDIDACYKRNTCSITRKAELSGYQRIACSTRRRCTDMNLTCHDIIDNIRNIYACIDARVQVIAECFQGEPDNGHRSAISQELDALTTCRNAFVDTNQFLQRNRGKHPDHWGCHNQGFLMP
jgi:hypothetical protein